MDLSAQSIPASLPAAAETLGVIRFSLTHLNVQWFILLGVLLTGYAILDGFDLGVGILHFVARNDRERRIMMNSIGPIWDGNEVWLVTFGGALFAAFPDCYATVFSGFYTAFMLLLFALIFRGVSLEFRGKRESPLWRTAWDFAFSVSSGVVALLFGVAVGNAMAGLPVGPDREMRTSLVGLLGLYPVLVGLLAVTLFAMHGGLYLCLKTDGELRQRVETWVRRLFVAFLVVYALVTVNTLVNMPGATQNFRAMPWAWGVVALNVLAIANIPRALRKNKPMQAFLSSACVIAALVFLFGMALFPNLVISSIDHQYNLTILNADSSARTLWIMRLIALIGMPLVIGYSAAIYWIFRGKTQVGSSSY